YRGFDLDTRNIRLQPVAKDILIQHLGGDQARYKLISGDGIVEEPRPEDYLVRGLIDFDDICYDDHADLLYKLAGQAVKHLWSYLHDEEKVLNVLQFHQHELTRLIHSQMAQHYDERATEYEVHATKGFTKMRPANYSAPEGTAIQNYRIPVDDRLMIRGMVFGGFKKCLYPVQKFDADSERRFAAVLEGDSDVIKWFKPPKGALQIFYRHEIPYEPDFVAETPAVKFLIETKRADYMNDEEVRDKAKAAALWCEHASQHGDKKWVYLLIPHDRIQDNMTLAGLAGMFTFAK
ncbi:type III restriction endonuclease subunit R, partial [Candidatus Sumerlaeota bacterium]|nr:type III restriction endonuclease subunit R [Candidatus Sumerlaeota bacterium]